MMPRFLRRADRIIAVSENTRRDALRSYALDPEKIEVIPKASTRGSDRSRSR